MKTKKLIFALIIGMALVFTACPDSIEEISVEQAKAYLTEDVNQMATDMKMASKAKGTEVLMSFEHYMESSVKGSELAGSLVYLSQVQQLKTISSSRFNIKSTDEFGTYTWNMLTSTWDYSADPTDHWVYVFPSSIEDSTFNDAVLTLKANEGFTLDSETPPSSIYVLLTVKSEKYFELDFKATFTEEIPEKIDLKIFNSPLQLNANYVYTANSPDFLHSVGFELKINNAFVTGLGVDLSVMGSLSEEFSNLAIPTKLEGFYQLYRFKIEGIADLQTLYAEMITDLGGMPSIEVLNETIDFDLIYAPNGMKIADIVFKNNPAYNPDDPNNSSDIPFIIMLSYTDGTEEDFIAYFKEVADQIEALLEEYALKQKK